MKKPSRRSTQKPASSNTEKLSYEQRQPPRRGLNASRSQKPKTQKPAKAKASRGNKTTQVPASSRSSHLLAGLLNWGGTVILWGVLLVGIVMGYFAYTLPSISGIDVIEKRPSLILKSDGGQTFATYGDLYGRMLKPEQIPVQMKQAVLATEDAHFYSHFGINPFSLVRAMWRNYQAGRVVEGGSTITQQLAKNLFLTPERSMTRKIREVLLAFWLEANYSKEEILALYLNRMYFGSGTFGIDAATRKYFNKDISKLTINEAALLAGLLKAPTYYAPTVNLKRSQQRSTVVIRRMQAEEFITKAQADKLVKNPATLRHAGSNFKNVRYFSDWVVSEVRSYVGRNEDDLEVTTSLDLNLQKAAEQAIETQLSKNGNKFGVSQAALVAMSPEGEVKAMVGGRSYGKSSFNRATSAYRQPGSVFKTIVYTAGFEAGRHSDDIYYDGPVNINGWKPENYTRKYQGNITLREAFAKSINTVAIRLSEDIGRHRVVNMAARLGLGGDMKAHPSIALGTQEVTLLDMSSAYAVIANGGHGVIPYAVKEIRNRKGEVLYSRKSSGRGQMIKGQTVNEMRDIMTSAMKTGTGRSANPGFPAAGKTGTTQDYRDAWFIGFTPKLVAGVWFGNDDGTATKKVTGSNLPSYAWKDFMVRALGTKNQPVFTAVNDTTPSENQDSIWDKIVQTFSSGGTSNSPQVKEDYPADSDTRP
ncbi:transglycosylase domain-containing protein [Sneathiella limimaris]|uniref:transglycosylase domain-containing protein n=1 Tax=Sneathiella limimaris TaxID=1964213 RepID=UPI00146A11F7|nr:PBP1A family penicillin-binding protein [Sneathiella limimaris]